MITQIPVTGTPFNVWPEAGAEHIGTWVGGVAAYEHPPLLQVPGDSWHTSGGVVQSVLTQQLAVGMQAPPQSLSPAGQAQPAAVHTSPPAHAIEPLQVHVPALHVFVVLAAQSPLVQQLAERMHDDPQSR